MAIAATTDRPGAPADITPPAPHRFGRVFWTLNTIEMWERLAFYNLRVMAPIYLMQADNPGGLHLTATDKGVIYAWWAVFQSLLPIVTGGLADRFGYKRTLVAAISLMMAGYLMMGGLRDVPWLNNYWGFFLAILTLATGTAFFKPSLQASLAHQLTRANSSVGWGVFYWVVNVGAFAGHFLPSLFLLKGLFGAAVNSPTAWRNLFLASAFFTGLNLLLLLTFKDIPSGASKTETVWQVLKRTVANITEPRLAAWMAIMSCFWLMMYQLWDLQPNYIADWVDSRPLAAALGWLPPAIHRMVVEETARGPMIPQQVLLSFNAFFIILGVVGMAWLTRRMRTLSAMFLGMILATAGILVAGWTQNAWVLVAGILCFSLGEMMTGPKKSEYLGLIAPPGKKGLYLGYVNIPVGVGVFFGSWIAGLLYGRYGEKAVLALRYLAEKTPFGTGRPWDGDVASLPLALGVERTDAMLKLQEVTGLDPAAATQLLWNTYAPHHVWIPFACVGVVAAAGLYVFGRLARRWSDMNA
ncbi:MAG: MFS transporter [Verrucomicrobia bacterium]|nr:MFS transporter [Verrucomicrobiota bacterium]